MKLKIHKKSKKVLILILLLLLAFSGLQLSFTMLVPKTMMKETVQFEATCQPNVGYQVMIKPNEVYSGTVQKEGEIYSKKLLNYIQTDFEIKYLSSRPAPFDIEYQILATVNGYQGKDKDKANYWSKSFPVTNKNVIKDEKGSASWSKKERVNFQLSPYDAFATRAKDITGMDVSNEVLLSMTGKITAHMGEEDLEIPISTSILIPLMEDVFQIKKTGTDPVNDSISVKAAVPKPVNRLNAVFFGTLFLLCMIGLIAVIFFSREPNHEEMLFKRANAIIKNYGSRIVALQSIPKMNYRQHYRVHSMKDMVKIADELQKPIFYEVDSATVVKDYEFHIIEEDTIYSLFLDSAEA